MVATIDAPAEHVTRRMGEAALEVEPLGNNRCRITAAADTLPWLAFRLLGLDADFEVHEPADLRNYISQLGERLGRAGAETPG